MGCVGHRTVAVVFGTFVITFERVRARFYCYGSNCLTQRSHPTYISSFCSPNSKDSLAGSASPICSQSLGYEHGRIAKRSLSFRKEMSRVLQPFSALVTMLGTSATELMARRPAPLLLNHTKAFPHTSRTSPQGELIFHSSLL